MKEYFLEEEIKELKLILASAKNQVRDAIVLLEGDDVDEAIRILKITIGEEAEDE